ncbi:MAG: AAA family ATPase [Anaerolineae bacterium]|nr:AAA family ATPase [Anaerolineae bacterium]
MTVPLTFLFTDLQDSTSLWENFAEEMQIASARHDALLRSIIDKHGGRVVKTTGDGFHAVFESPLDAVTTALAGQQAIAVETWSDATGTLKVRMGLHTGESQQREGDYYGAEVNRAARVMGIGHGGQVLVSEVTATLVRASVPDGVTLTDLGQHRLRGLTAPEHIFQLCHPDLPAEFPPLTSLESFRHNLPVQLTSFVGRDQELARVKELLAQTRLLTLLGPGGTGKTRLSLQAAADVVDQFPDGVWFAELAPVTDPGQVVARVAATLNVQEQPGRPLLDALTNHLRRKELLLLLDNVEHLVRECAELAEHLLMHCPAVKILVTGRESLFIGGETTLQIPSLSLPAGGTPALEEVASSEAVQLFLARAQAVRPDFTLTPENAPALADVVRRLDGIPLALELAAARLRMMSVEQIAARLNDRFRLLTGGRRTALPRQQTLQALIDWSWNLLDQKEQILLRRLSVFSGGWTLEAAQAVASDDQLDAYDVFDLLEQLVNKSLVTVVHLPQEAVRFNMLESIRQYALNRLVEADEGERLFDRHAEYYTEFGEQVSQALQGRDMLVWLARLLPETDNAKAARGWAIDKRLDLALRMAGAPMLVARYWFFSSEDIGWLEQVVTRVRARLDAAQDSELHQELPKAVVALGSAVMLAGDYDRGRHILEEGIDLARKAGDIEQQVVGLNMLLVTLFHMREPAAAVDIAEQSLALSRQHGIDFWHLMTLGYLVPILVVQNEQQRADKYLAEAIRLAQKVDNPWLTAFIALQQTRVEIRRGNWEQAEVYAAQAADLFEDVRDFGMAMTARSESGHMKRKMGDWAGAEQVYRKTILAYQEQGHTPAVAHQLECMGYIAVNQDQYFRAARMLGAAQAVRASIQVNRLPQEQIEFDEALGYLETVMGKAERDWAVRAGGQMSLDEAVSLALECEA